MAVIEHTSTDLGDNRLVVWDGVTEADSFEAFNLSQYDYKEAVIQVGGTLGGATITVNGSNDGTTYAGLDDPHGTAISVTGDAVEGFALKPAYIQPVRTGGTGASITVKIFLRR